MRKLLLIALVMLVLAFGGCSLFMPKLTIVNMTSSDLDFITWYDDDGEEYTFGSDQVWDTVLGEWVDGLRPGSGDTQDVWAGTSPVFFFAATSDTLFWTVETISVELGDDKIFTLYDSTLVYFASEKSALSLVQFLANPDLAKSDDPVKNQYNR